LEDDFTFVEKIISNTALSVNEILMNDGWEYGSIPIENPPPSPFKKGENKKWIYTLKGAMGSL
jgi:hypothetical protein